MGHMGRLKTIGVHYEGDTSRYDNGHHEHYDGNGRLRHMGGIFSDWKLSNWGNEYGMERFFLMDMGTVSVMEAGLYYVYAQVITASGSRLIIWFNLIVCFSSSLLRYSTMMTMIPTVLLSNTTQDRYSSAQRQRIRNIAKLSRIPAIRPA